jgi:acetolactate synthase-1/2/3 large subunit
LYHQLTFFAVGNIAGTIQMMSEKVSEPIIDQKHLDDLEELRANL